MPGNADFLLTRERISEYWDLLEPLLSPLQRLAMEAAWLWFERLWEDEQIDARTFHALDAVISPRLDELIFHARNRDDNIVELVAFLRGLDLGAMS